jgi:hypothetical protein
MLNALTALLAEDHDDSAKPPLETSSTSEEETEAEVEATTLPEPWGGNYFSAHLNTLIDAYFSSPRPKSKDKAFDNRIRNACHLLVAADCQSSDAIGLSLSITAIETLLAKDNNSIAHSVAECFANLFEPDLKERYKAFAFAKKLYNQRSRVLHGEDIDLSGAERSQARLCAAAAMIAILERQRFVGRTCRKKKEKPEDFFKELEAHRYMEGPFVGVPVPPISHLWIESSK